jgi:8-oxo-dGTP pyrophosphatase MutT (NUDIX family)
MVVTPLEPWQALSEARHRHRPRRPLLIDGEAVGSVDETHLPMLARWRDALVAAGSRSLTLRLPRADRDAWFAEVNAILRAEGLIQAWRDESFVLPSPATGRELAVIERASARFWGTLTLGAHANGWVAGPDGQPAWLWIARRAETKPTDPGKWDNLIGGGVPRGQTPAEALVREGFEEAGLSPTQMARARAGRIVTLCRDIPEGLQFERLHVFDLELQPDEHPVNQDGEVMGVERMPLEQAAALASTDTMTVDASLVTLEFLLRRNLIADPEARHRLAAASALLFNP